MGFSESKGDTETSKPSFFTPKKIILFLVLLALLAAVVLFISKQNGEFSVDKIVSSVKNSIKSPPAAAEVPVTPAPPTRAPRNIPEQGAQAEV